MRTPAISPATPAGVVSSECAIEVVVGVAGELCAAATIAGAAVGTDIIAVVGPNEPP